MLSPNNNSLFYNMQGCIRFRLIMLLLVGSQEILHQTRCARLVNFSPNGTSFLVAAVELRVFTVCVVKNSQHEKLLQQAGMNLSSTQM